MNNIVVIIILSLLITNFGWLQTTDNTRVIIEEEMARGNPAASVKEYSGVASAPIDSVDEYIEIDQQVYAASVNDPLYEEQWYLPHINAPLAWSNATGSSKIAVLDTGVNNHEDINLTASIDCSGDDCVDGGDIDANGHGTAVAGAAGAKANNNIGVASVCQACEIISVKVLNDQGVGHVSNIVEGIYWAVSNNVDIINMSFGAELDESPTLTKAIDYAYDNDIILVGAAGNNNSDDRFYPAAYDKVLAVGAVGPNNEKAEFSNFGNWVNIYAPGVRIHTTCEQNYCYMDGTSLSTPIVSGAAAVLREKENISNEEVFNMLSETGTVNTLDFDNFYEAPDGDVVRLAGDDRIETAVEISKYHYPNGSNVVGIARADDFADSLVGGPLMTDGPILLTHTDRLPDDTVNEILRLNPDKVFIFGGTEAVSNEVQTELELLTG